MRTLSRPRDKTGNGSDIGRATASEGGAVEGGWEVVVRRRTLEAAFARAVDREQLACLDAPEWLVGRVGARKADGATN